MALRHRKEGRELRAVITHTVGQVSFYTALVLISHFINWDEEAQWAACLNIHCDETSRLHAGDDGTCISWPCSYFVPELCCQYFNNALHSPWTVFTEALIHAADNIRDESDWLEVMKSCFGRVLLVDLTSQSSVRARRETRWSRPRCLTCGLPSRVRFRLRGNGFSVSAVILQFQVKLPLKLIKCAVSRHALANPAHRPPSQSPLHHQRPLTKVRTTLHISWEISVSFPCCLKWVCQKDHVQYSHQSEDHSWVIFLWLPGDNTINQIWLNEVNAALIKQICLGKFSLTSHIIVSYLLTNIWF